MPLSIYDRLFGSALADTQQRGADFSPDAPWALALSAFPEARRLRPGATLDDIMRDAQRFLMTGSAMPPPPPPRPPEGPSPAVLMEGTNPSGVPTSNPGAIGQVTGVSPGAIGTAVSGLGLAAGIPGLAAPALSQGITGAKGVMGLLGLLGLMPDEDLSVTTEQGPVPAAVVGPTGLTGLTSAIANAIGIPGVNAPVTVAVGPHNEISAVPTAAVNAGWVDTTGLTSNNPDQGDPSVNNPNVSEPGTGPGGAAGSASGPSAGGSGDSGGQAPYRGGWLKGPRTSKVKVPKAHGGEFVVNATAAKKAAPWLEALNAMHPPNPDLDALLDKARKHLEI